MGDRSADGTRMFDGKYWVLQRTERFQESAPRIDEHLPLREFAHERSGGFGFSGLIIASAVGLVIAYAPYPAPSASSVEDALQMLAISILIRIWGTFIAVVLILSIGRRPIDIMLARSMIVAFVLGFPLFFGLGLLLTVVPTGARSTVPYIALPFIAGAIYAVTLGPVIAIVATVANLLWYRSFRSLKPWLLSRRKIRDS